MLYQTHGLQNAYNFPIKINFILSFGKPLIYIIYLLCYSSIIYIYCTLCILYISLHYLQSEDNAALTPLVEYLLLITEYSSKIAMENSTFKVSDLVAGVAPVGGAATTYSTYDGSLTTPGCNEVVHWINFLTPLKISVDQLAWFRTLNDKHENEISDNFRPPQPLNGRVVEFYGAA